MSHYLQIGGYLEHVSRPNPFRDLGQKVREYPKVEVPELLSVPVYLLKLTSLHFH